MQLFETVNIDFMGHRRLWLSISAILIAASVFVLASRGIRQGVEFAGGAEVLLHYVEAPSLDAIRGTLADAGFQGVTVTTFGESEGKEIAIRVALPETGAAEEEGRDLARKVVAALRPDEVERQIAAGKIDLNVADAVTLERRLREEAGLPEDEAATVAEALTAFRREHAGVFESLDQALNAEGVTDAAREFLRANAFVGPFGLRGQEVIAAAVSGEMRQKAYLAITGALVFMLIYIWIRFQLQYGLAAILALVHDTVITLGAFSAAGLEANLPVVAAFLTLVGYSVNDTIVVFDRVRENIKAKGTGKFAELINLSINQTLSRTLITSGTTWVVVAAMFFFGGPVIRPFAFVLLVGVIIGTYSSIYIASPVLLFWHNVLARRGARGKAGRRAAARG